MIGKILIFLNCVAGGLFKIVHSKLQDFPVGSVVYGFGPSWCKYTILTRAQIMTNITSYPKEIHSAFLHTLGIAGLTAHHGLLHICTPKEGETVVISSASSTVAGLVAAIAKIKKLRVVGLTHSPKRVDELTQTGYFDAIVVSNTDMKTFSAALKQAAPKAIN